MSPMTVSLIREGFSIDQEDDVGGSHIWVLSSDVHVELDRHDSGSDSGRHGRPESCPWRVYHDDIYTLHTTIESTINRLKELIP
jgi:hypothetical protein